MTGQAIRGSRQETDGLKPAGPNDASRNIREYIGSHAERNPDAVAIAAPGRSPLTYGGLLRHVEYIVKSVNGMGVGRNDRVAIVLLNGPEMATAFLGVGACATAAPLNPAYRADE